MNVNDSVKAATICCVCSEMHTDPKTLPCFHTYCLKCLEATASKANKMPGDDMQCPVCRKEFSIPQEGLAILPKNLFIERLITLTKILNTSDGPCDACMDGLESSSSDARVYCSNCSLKLCESCSKHHRKSKVTRAHKLIAIENQPITAELMESFATNLCEEHQNEELKLYCIECECTICALCYIESHQNHQWTNVKITAEDYRKSLHRNVTDISTCVKIVKQKQRQLETEKSNTDARFKELKTEVDKHAHLLHKQLELQRKEKVNAVETEREDVNRHNICLESYMSHVTEVANKATFVDICQAFKSINARFLELKDIHESMIHRQLVPVEASFEKTDLQELFASGNRNSLGPIDQEKPECPTKTMADLEAEIKQLQITNDQLKREVETEKSNSQQEIEEFFNLFLQRMDAAEKREMEDAMKIQKLEELKWQSICERRQILERQKTLEKLMYQRPPEEIDYRDVQVTVQQIGTYSFSERAITGLTIIESMLYVTSEHSQFIDGYDLTTFLSSFQMSVTGLVNPRDMAKRAESNYFVYIMDLKCDSVPNEIINLGLKWNKIQKRWSTGDDCGTLSVTCEGNVLLTVKNKNKLNEYTWDGQIIREIKLWAGIDSPWHAIKLTNGHYLVSYGYVSYFLYFHFRDSGGICIVDEDGDLLKASWEENKNSVYCPEYLAVDSRGSIMAANSRGEVLLLGSNLKYKKDLLGWCGQCYDRKMHLDESNGPRLYVVDDRLKSSIRILNFEPQIQPVVRPRLLQRAMEMTIKGLSRIVPVLFKEREVNETLIRALQSQETDVVAGAIEGIALLSAFPAIILGLIFMLIFSILYIDYSNSRR